ncbi:hypothetical protein LTR10_010400 [Elasticomyces elasticus]|nr:hypothetical protein LTR10_010400 [Elasticomyces elasticus]KAK4972302.1 hypothetical protein LTR42_006809 [Elasticomyces elasticus]
MATPPLMKMPTEIVSNITSHLSIRELTRFRVVSRWTENETLRDFADRTFKIVQIKPITFMKLAGLLWVITGGSRLAPAVRTLEVQISPERRRIDKTWTVALTKANENVLSGQQNPAGHKIQPTVWQLAGRLPQLEKLGMRNMESTDLVAHILPRLCPSGVGFVSPWCRLKTLEVRDCFLGSTEWQMLILSGPTLQTLCLSDVSCAEGWIATLGAMQQSLTELHKVELERFLVHGERPETPWDGS